MTRTATAALAAALSLSAGAALPAGTSAHGGTAAPQPGSGVTGATAPDAAAGAPGALQAGAAALYGRRQRVSGTVPGAGTDVLVQRSDPAAGWTTVAQPPAGRDGTFTATWRADRVGRLTLRAVPASAAVAASAASAAPTARTTVYRAAIATHFGPGWYGSRTACGTVLTARTVGVAHKTLPCGTLVEFYYRGRTLRAPVVDRGPYANNAAWDLTMAASRALRFNGKDHVGAIAVGRAQPRP